jgi:hypothetical protein
LNLGDEVEIVYERVTDPDPYETVYYCPACDHRNVCMTLTGEIKDLAEAIPYFDKGADIILKCSGCKKLFRIKELDLDGMTLKFIGLST